MGARLGTTLIGNTGHGGNDRMGANAVAPVSAQGVSQPRKILGPTTPKKAHGKTR